MPSKGPGPNWGKGYEDPRWQKRAADIKDRTINVNGEWVCEDCGSTRRTLSTHHKFYRDGPDGYWLPLWEYEDDELTCICDLCHRRREQVRAAMHWFGGYLDPGNVDQALGYAYALLREQLSAGPERLTMERQRQRAETIVNVFAKRQNPDAPLITASVPR